MRNRRLFNYFFPRYTTCRLLAVLSGWPVTFLLQCSLKIEIIFVKIRRLNNLILSNMVFLKQINKKTSVKLQIDYCWKMITDIGKVLKRVCSCCGHFRKRGGSPSVRNIRQQFARSKITDNLRKPAKNRLLFFECPVNSMYKKSIDQDFLSYCVNSVYCTGGRS